MNKAILWGLGLGVLSVLWNYIIFIKIFPVGKILKMNKMMKFLIVFCPTLLNIYFLGVVHRFFLKELLAETQRFVLIDHIFQSLSVLPCLGSIWWFVILPFVKETKNFSEV